MILTCTSFPRYLPLLIETYEFFSCGSFKEPSLVVCCPSRLDGVANCSSHVWNMCCDLTMDGNQFETSLWLSKHDCHYLSMLSEEGRGEGRTALMLPASQPASQPPNHHHRHQSLECEKARHRGRCVSARFKSHLPVAEANVLPCK